MKEINTDQLQKALISAAKLIIENEPYLTEVDTIIGDGDHGSGMKMGFTALLGLLQNQKYETLYELLHASGLELIRTMGGASGVLFGTLFIGGLSVVEGKQAMKVDELVDYFNEGTEAVMRRGRCGPGSKTMIDALVPAMDAMKKEMVSNFNILDVLGAGVAGAKQGVENTKHMIPTTGRAKNFREEAIGYPDPGAISVSILFEGLVKGIQ